MPLADDLKNLMAAPVSRFTDFPGEAIRAVEALEGHDRRLLLAHAKRLKQTDGEGWAIGEMVERVIEACAE